MKSSNDNGSHATAANASTDNNINTLHESSHSRIDPNNVSAAVGSSGGTHNNAPLTSAPATTMTTTTTTASPYGYDGDGDLRDEHDDDDTEDEEDEDDDHRRRRRRDGRQRQRRQHRVASHRRLENADADYTIEIARRSVARAALNLGVERMSGEALDGAADAMLEFLARVGRSMAASVEASRRPSSHCNVLDAMSAVERGLSSQRFSRPWQDELATFAFGANWEAKEVDFDTDTVVDRRAVAADGGGPSDGRLGTDDGATKTTATTTTPRADGEKASNGTHHRTSSDHGVGVGVDGDDRASGDGPWNAPYLDVVPPYPIVRGDDRLTTLWSVATEAEACRGELDGVPDVAKSAATAAAAANDPSLDHRTTSERAFKRARFGEIRDEPTNDVDGAKPTTSAPTPVAPAPPPYRPAYVPSHLPPFPPRHTYRSRIVAADAAPPRRDATDAPSSSAEAQEDVRRSLVDQSRRRRPNGDVGTSAATAAPTSTSDLDALAVPFGGGGGLRELSSASAGSGVGGAAGVGTTPGVGADRREKSGTSTASTLSSKNGAGSASGGSAITPLDKISSARVSRILEGSMDPSHCG